MGVCVGSTTGHGPRTVRMINSPGTCPGVLNEHTVIVPPGGIVGIGFNSQSNPIGVAGLRALPLVI